MLVDEENTLAEMWTEQDERSAQQTARALIPLLILKNGEKEQTLALAPLTSGCPPFKVIQFTGGVAVKLTPAKKKKSYLPFRPMKAFKRSNKSGREEGGLIGREGKLGIGMVRDKGVAMQPAPLRCALHCLKGVPFHLRYRGEGPLEKPESYSVEKENNEIPTLLAHQVVRLGGNIPAIVRVVLEPPAKCNIIHHINDNHGDQVGRCQVRCVVRTEAYLSESSTTLTIHVRAATSAGHGRKEQEQPVEEECRSRTRQLQALKIKREAEVNRGELERCIVFQRAHTESSGAKTQSEQPQGSRADHPGGEPRRSSAFSTLLIRANINVPIKRVDLGSGSWRETIGRLVGCPLGQDLRMVR